jgi:hypothetical protein
MVCMLCETMIREERALRASNALRHFSWKG